MAWFWIAIAAGLVIPWLILPRAIWARFEDGGIRSGLTIWLGTSAVTVPVTFLLVWVVYTFLR